MPPPALRFDPHALPDGTAKQPRRANRGSGKSDPIDAYAAARQALAEASSLPIVKTGEGLVEQIRSLLVVRRSAMKSRVAALRQIKSLERVNLFVYGVVMFGGYRYLLTRSG